MMLMIMMMMGETESEKVTPLCFRACNFINTDQIYTKFRKKKQYNFILKTKS